MGFTKPTTRDRKKPHPWLRVWVLTGTGAGCPEKPQGSPLQSLCAETPPLLLCHHRAHFHHIFLTWKITLNTRKLSLEKALSLHPVILENSGLIIRHNQQTDEPSRKLKLCIHFKNLCYSPKTKRRMSSRPYNLRARSTTGVATQSDRALDIRPVPDDSSPLSDLARRTVGESPEAGAIIVPRTYSDVVASRPPSPREERPTTPSERSYIDHDFSSATSSPDDENDVNNVHNRIDIAIHTLGHLSDAPVSQEDLQRTTVKRRRARSLSSSKKMGWGSSGLWNHSIWDASSSSPSCPSTGWSSILELGGEY